MPSSEVADSNNDISLGKEEDDDDDDVSVLITAQSINVQFKGPLQSVLRSTVEFFIKQFPEVDLARKISLNYNKDYLIKKYSGLIKINPEGGVQVLAQPDTPSSTVVDIMQEETPNESGLKDDTVVALEAASAESSKTKHDVKWSTKEFIALHLVASRIAKGCGIIQDEGMKISDIESATKANPKSVTSRLSEMIRSGYVTKDLKFGIESAAEGKQGKEPNTRYRITTAGIHWLNNIIDKKVKIVNG